MTEEKSYLLAARETEDPARARQIFMDGVVSGALEAMKALDRYQPEDRSLILAGLQAVCDHLRERLDGDERRLYEAWRDACVIRSGEEGLLRISFQEPEVCPMCEALKGRGPVRMERAMLYSIKGLEEAFPCPMWYCPVCGAKLEERNMDWVEWFETAASMADYQPGEGNG